MMKRQSNQHGGANMLTHREADSIRSMMKRIRRISTRSDMWVQTTKQLDKAWLALMDALKSAEKWP
jgi:hypothetical protein